MLATASRLSFLARAHAVLLPIVLQAYLPHSESDQSQALPAIERALATSRPTARGEDILLRHNTETRFAERLASRAKRGGGDELPGVEGFDVASGLAEPTPECRRIMNGWLGKCVFGKAPALLQTGARAGDIPGIDGYDAAAGLTDASEECKKVMNGWMSKCVFSKAADATQPAL